MKRKKELLKSELDSVFVSKKLVIKKEGNEWFFEIGKEMTFGKRNFSFWPNQPKLIIHKRFREKELVVGEI
jgi:hypothetical protein